MDRVNDFKGRVISGEYGRGTKSERPAFFLETLDGKQRYLLRRKGGPSYVDATVAKLEGKVVVCSGFLLRTTLLAEDIRVAE